MTAHYNGYFNAREEIKLSLASYREGSPEDYTELIPVFIYPDKERVGDVMQSMETAIEKTSVVISKNSMPNPEKSKKQKREEWCKWIDDNWFVMAQAEFYKRDYEAAERLLKYIKVTYPTQETVFYADLWLAKCAIERKDYALAQSLLDQLTLKIDDIENGNFIQNPNRSKYKARRYEKYDIARPLADEPPPIPKHFRGELYMVYADMYLRKKEYENASQSIKDALTRVKKKKTRTRLTFILAQIAHEQGHNSAAVNYYTQVTKMTAPYEMEFYARIYRALLYNGEDIRGLRGELKKMLKDEKNIDYLDQIYYALAELDFREGKREDGIKNLEQSARYSKTNVKQKAKTYTRLADVYYEDKKYPIAKEYYDSSLTVIDDSYAGYEQILERRDGLTELVTNLDTYHTQDSLLKLVNSGETAYMQSVYEIIEEKKRQDQLKFEERQSQMASAGTGSSSQDYGSGANWYFYNEQAKAFGYNEFRTNWGDRKLEDNWRRKDKSIVLANPDEELDDSASVAENDPYSVEYYLKDLPLEESQQVVAHDKIANALYNLGVIYKERLGEPETGMQYFEEMVKRYGDTTTGLPGMYQLYLGYKSLGKTAESDTYKMRILNEYPESEYAKIIRNPNFKKNEELSKRVHGEEYEKVYALYEEGAYDTVIASCDAIVSRDEPNAFKPKLLLLKAFALGARNAEDLDAISKPLEILVTHHIETEEGKKAKSILDKLRNQVSKREVEEGSSNFVFNADMQHFFVIFFPEESGEVRVATATVSDYNSLLFGSRNLKTKHTILNDNMRMIVVRSFNNQNEAMQYYTVFKNDRKYVNELNEKYQFAVITHKNYAAMITLREMADYMDFFESNYK